MQFDNRGVEVNEFLQSTSSAAVYAAGDAAASPGWPLTPVASLEGKVAAANLLWGNHEKPDYAGVPSVVFTIPELTRVGLLETEARQQGLDFTCKFNEMSDWYSVERAGENSCCSQGAGRARLRADRRRPYPGAGRERVDQHFRARDAVRPARLRSREPDQRIPFPRVRHRVSGLVHRCNQKSSWLASGRGTMAACARGSRSRLAPMIVLGSRRSWRIATADRSMSNGRGSC